MMKPVGGLPPTHETSFEDPCPSGHGRDRVLKYPQKAPSLSTLVLDRPNRNVLFAEEHAHSARLIRTWTWSY